MVKVRARARNNRGRAPDRISAVSPIQGSVLKPLSPLALWSFALDHGANAFPWPTGAWQVLDAPRQNRGPGPVFCT